jgi:hypothetical protein
MGSVNYCLAQITQRCPSLLRHVAAGSPYYARAYPPCVKPFRSTAFPCTRRTRLDEDWTPLLHAASKGNIDVCRFLLEAGATLTEVDEDCIY